MKLAESVAIGATELFGNIGLGEGAMVEQIGHSGAAELFGWANW